MIDIVHTTELTSGSETKRGHGLGIVLGLCLCVVAGGAYWFWAHRTPAVVVDPQAILAAVKAEDVQWAKAAGARDVEKVLKFYADGATVMPPHAELAANKAGIRKIWTEKLVPATDIEWTPGTAEISASNDVVYEEGFYLTKTKVAKGEPTLDRGKYLSIWRKQDDGNWKSVAHMWNSDLPVAPAAPARRR